VDAGAVVIAAQRVADEHGVVARGVEPAVGFVPQREAGQLLAVFAGEGLLDTKSRGATSPTSPGSTTVLMRSSSSASFMLAPR
jgi:hypothetical protein